MIALGRRITDLLLHPFRNAPRRVQTCLTCPRDGRKSTSSSSTHTAHYGLAHRATTELRVGTRNLNAASGFTEHRTHRPRSGSRECLLVSPARQPPEC